MPRCFSRVNGCFPLRTDRAGRKGNNPLAAQLAGAPTGGILSQYKAQLLEQLKGVGQHKGRTAKGEQATQLNRLIAEIEALLQALEIKN